MADANKIHSAIQTVKDQKSFIKNLLIGALSWKIPEGTTEVEEISYSWTLDELHAEGLNKKIVDGQIRQIQPLEKSGKQPWGIFLLEFKNIDAFIKGRGLTGILRQVLRGLVRKKRQQTNRPAWDRENLLFICTHNYEHYRFAYFKKPEEAQLAPLSTFGWGPDIPCRTVCEFNLPSLEWPKDSDNIAMWTQHWQAAFDKEKLSKLFFEQYKALADILRSDLNKQSGDLNWAHDFTLQLLNRVMFLHFIQRKRWLGNDSDFLTNFWSEYNATNQPADSFFEKWLKVLFFEAFNNKFNYGHSHFSHKIKEALSQAPYLNGGLFIENPIDRQGDTYDVSISDKRIKQIFDFFGKYNFTVSEDTPLDKDVAVDPEMIGMVYESLVNISEDEDRRGEAGIFYTPRFEIDMMCRLSLVDWLSNNIGAQHKELLYKWIFAYDEKDKNEATNLVVTNKLINPLKKLLSDITVLDPACGSGSFLVGMIHILDDLQERLEKCEKVSRLAYERRKEIIGSNLYGVDIKDWACHIAEIRLWLTLIIDVDMTAAELHIRNEPLLPNFSFKIRCGDSLVQEVGGVDMAHRRGSLDLSQSIKNKLAELRREKIRFYNNDPQRKFGTVEELEQLEVKVFRDLLEDRITAIEGKAKDLMRIQAQKEAHQQRNLITGELEGPSKQFTLDREQREKETAALMEEKSRLENALNGLRGKANAPFVWDIAYAEIFGADESGFDIVIGNPPYVRQENIADPNPHIDRRQAIQTDAKKLYKTKVAKSVYKAFPWYFDYKEGIEKAKHELDKKSDLYIYFYFKGLSLLNDRGTFCFITSNSWLDVGYGADLQEFLLRRSHVKMVIDNKAKRSFKSADVNTVIVLLAAPLDKKASEDVSLANAARFIMFNVPFEEAVSTQMFLDTEKAKGRVSRDKYRVFADNQRNLLEEGLERIENEEEQKVKKKAKSPGFGIKIDKYIGNKWGGKYLRAPDIYWSIVNRLVNNMIPFNSAVAKDYGIKPGCVEFFYVSNETKEQFDIEERFVVPIINSSRAIDSIYFEANTNLFYCHEPKKSLMKGTLNYIEWGEKQGFDKLASTKAHRPYWYSITGESVDFLLLQFWDKRFWTPIAKTNPVYCSNNFFYGRCFHHRDNLLLQMNSSWYFMQIELFSRANQGQGVLTTYGTDYDYIKFIQPSKFNDKEVDLGKALLEEMSQRSILPIWDELKLADRKALDDIVFNAIGLNKSEREEVYFELNQLVKKRIERASSLD